MLANTHMILNVCLLPMDDAFKAAAIELSTRLNTPAPTDYQLVDQMTGAEDDPAHPARRHSHPHCTVMHFVVRREEDAVKRLGRALRELNGRVVEVDVAGVRYTPRLGSWVRDTKLGLPAPATPLYGATADVTWLDVKPGEALRNLQDAVHDNLKKHMNQQGLRLLTATGHDYTPHFTLAVNATPGREYALPALQTGDGAPTRVPCILMLGDCGPIGQVRAYAPLAYPLSVAQLD